MKHTVFYSWQADHPNATNRGFIQQSLEEAAAAVAAELNVEPVIERDTQDVPGSPDIAQTIFKKIAAADVFVADVTLINPKSAKRRTPNPNVLLELGYALRGLGDERVILVFNRAFGGLEQLPFDLKMRRVIPYDMPLDAAERAPERKRLAAVLREAIKSAIASKPAESPSPSAVDLAIAAVESTGPNRALLVRRAMDRSTADLGALAPPMFRGGGTSADLVDAIAATVPAVHDLTRLADAVSAMNDGESARSYWKALAAVLEGYDNPRGFSGTSDLRDFDFWKFLGHELVVTFVALLLRDERFQMLDDLLNTPITVRNPPGRGGATPVTFQYAAAYLQGLDDLKKEKNRMSFHADLLHDRHDIAGPLGDLLSFDLFLSADYFLYLRDVLSTEGEYFEWCPWSTAYMRDIPEYISGAVQRTYASRLARAFGIPDAETMKQRMLERAGRLEIMWRSGHWASCIRKAHVDAIATR